MLSDYQVQKKIEILSNKLNLGNFEEVINEASILIKKNQLAKDVENARPSRFAKGDKVDAMIVELDKDKKTVTLSIKALEEKESKEALKKYGSTDSGAKLADILGPILKKTKTKK